MIILGIETSCDETALCLLETRQNGQNLEYRVLGNLVHSQATLHQEYGGVYPNLAKREHQKNLPLLFAQLKKDTGIKDEQIKAIAVTEGPGLEPALWTGLTFASELHNLYQIPLYPINHMEGHVVSTLINDAKPHEDYRPFKPFSLPALAVLISGGHTEIVKVRRIGEYEILGQTKDDAVGEAFDKVARILDLPYPGGPEISRLAEEARNENLTKEFSLPRPMLNSKDLNFSFSGLKTAVLYLVKKLGELSATQKKQMAREFEDSVTEVITVKTRQALEKEAYETLVVGGGVIANKNLREAFTNLAQEFSLPLYTPAPGLSGDNALMIALAGALHIAEGHQIAKNPESLKARGGLSLESEN